MSQTEFEKWLEQKSKRTRRGPAFQTGKKSSGLEPKQPKTSLKRGLARRLTDEEKAEKIKVKREKQKERAKRPKKKKTPLQRAVKQLDTVFSKFIHQRDHECYTCHSTEQLQNGHMFPKRKYMTIRWDERNCHLQCNDCNVVRSGNYKLYRQMFIDEYGQEAYDALLVDRDKHYELTLSDIKEKIKFYESRLSPS